MVGWFFFSSKNLGLEYFIPAILLFFCVLFLGYMGKERNNQLWVNLSRFITGFYIFGFLLAILLLIVFIIYTFKDFSF
jgi:hypothetical protein